MNPGPVEEAGKAVGGFMEVMKTQPLSLALVVMNVALLGFFWFILDRVHTTRQSEMAMIYKDHEQVRDLLARCVVPGPRADGAQRTSYEE